MTGFNVFTKKIISAEYTCLGKNSSKIKTKFIYKFLSLLDVVQYINM